MRIDNILEAAVKLCPTSSCAIYQHQNPTIGQSSAAASLTYQSATHLVKQHQEGIQTKLNNNNDSGKQGDGGFVVAILAHNSIDFLLALLACIKVPNILPVLVNTRWTHQEIAQALQSQNRYDRTILMYDTPEHAERLHQASELLRNNHRNISLMQLTMLSTSHQAPRNVSRERSEEHQSSNLQKTLPPQHIIDTHNPNSQEEHMNATAVILFTSGTTSGSKGVLLSHRALYVQALAKLQAPCGYDHQTRMLATTVPLFHVGGLSSALAVMLAGGALVFPTPSREPGFQPAQVLRSLHYGPRISTNTLVVVPAMLSALMEECLTQTAKTTYPSVRLILIGGQSASSSLLQLIFERFPNARVVQTYACTEGASSLTFWERQNSSNNTSSKSRTPLLENHTNPSMHHRQRQQMGDCVGVPPSHVELRLLPTNDDEQRSTDNRDIPLSGVIATRGPHLFTGYWKRGSSDGTGTRNGNNATSSLYACHIPLTPDGWFVTNDLGFQDTQGRYYFCGRVADVIRTGGETVLATEVERVLLRNDEIQECAVFPLPDSKFGETVCTALVVIPKSTSGPSLKEVRQWCAEQGLAGYKRPRRIFIMTELPRNSSGKLLKRLLVDRFHNETYGGSRVSPRTDPTIGTHTYYSKL